MFVVQYYDDGFRIGILAKEGTKYAQVIVRNGNSIGIKKFPVDDDSALDYLDYPIQKAVVLFLRAGKQYGITQAAKELLEAT